MNQPVNLNGLMEELAAAAPPEPKVFARSISTPAGLPWSQARMAALEARLGAPLPLHEVVYQLHRLDGWRPGAPAHYATFYVRAQDVVGEFVTTQQVDGRPISVRFLSATEQARRARGLLILALSAGALAAIVVASVLIALAARGAAEDRLASVEQLALRRLKQAEAEEQLRAQTRALDGAPIQGRQLSDVFRDLNWAAAAKAPSAHIEALHWAHGTLAVEVRGEANPFAQMDRNVVRVPKPLRPGVWLWGVTTTAPVVDTPPSRGLTRPTSSDYGDGTRGP